MTQASPAKVGIVCQIYADEGGRLRLETEVLIPRPRPGVIPVVIDMDPESERVLIQDSFDWPGSARWWLFSLNSQETVALGRAYPYGFFLQEDMVGEVLGKRATLGVPST